MKLSKKLAGLAGVTSVLCGTAIIAAPAAHASISYTNFNVTYPVTCTVSFFGPQNLSVNIKGKMPVSVPPKTKFLLKSMHYTIIVPASLAHAAATAGIKSANGTIGNLLFSGSGTSPASRDVGPQTIPLIQVVDNQPINLAVPPKGTIKATWKSAASGTSVITDGGSTSSVNFYADSAGTMPIATNQPVSCPATGTTIASVPIV